MLCRLPLIPILLVVMSAWGISSGRADPGTLLILEQRGGIQVTVWMDPARPQPGRVILKALVQNVSAGALVGDAEIVSRLESPSGAGSRPVDPVCGRGGNGLFVGEAALGWIPWGRQGSGNRLLQGVEMWLPTSGVWSLDVRVRVRGREEEFRVGIPVEPSGWGLGMILWGVGLPAVVVALYGVRVRGTTRGSVPR
ncbi:MAG: hypothetical protein RLZ45_339 [Verrucomicrobiota bacterium]